MTETVDDIMEPGLWTKDGWTARVIKNEDDDGWAVAMTRTGDPEPALVGPWTMGRDKKNPKPLSQGAFSTLVKTALEVLRRHEQTAYAAVHKSVTFLSDDGTRLRVDLDLSQDEHDQQSTLTCFKDATREELLRCRVPPAYKLTLASAERFFKTGQA